MSVMASRPPNMPAGAGGSKRPRLSLQIKPASSASSASTTTGSSTRPASRAFSMNPSDPTAFNTLSNAYVTAIERASTPVTSPLATTREPLTAINTFQAISLYSPISARPISSAYPATPLSAHTSSSSSSSQQNVMMPLPSVMSPTPPMSAGAVESNNSGGSKIFSFSPRDAAAGRHSLEQALHAAAASAAASTTTTPSSPMATPPKQRPATTTTTTTTTRTGLSGSPPPYTHAKALRSILRNSPLPSRRPASAPSLRRAAPTVRIQEDYAQEQRAAKRVCYHSPIEQEITTNTYTKSHIDLLVEEASTTSPSSPRRLPVDLSRAFTANEIQDGGQTPGPFEDESRRLGAAIKTLPAGGAAAQTSAPARGEKKRRWVWTIGRDEDADEDEEQLGGAVVAAARAAAAAAAGEGQTAEAPLLSVPKPKMTLDTSMTGVDMS